jgi:hypothetical protein
MSTRAIDDLAETDKRWRHVGYVGDEGAKVCAQSTRAAEARILQSETDPDQGHEGPIGETLIKDGGDVDPLELAYCDGVLKTMGFVRPDQATAFLRSRAPNNCQHLGDDEVEKMIFENGRNLLPNPCTTKPTHIHQDRSPIKRRPRGMKYKKKKTGKTNGRCKDFVIFLSSKSSLRVSQLAARGKRTTRKARVNWLMFRCFRIRSLCP